MNIPKVKKSEPLPKIFSKLAKKIAEAYKEEILEPAEVAIREWLEEISGDENSYSEDKIAHLPLCFCGCQMEYQEGCLVCAKCQNSKDIENE